MDASKVTSASATPWHRGSGSQARRLSMASPMNRPSVKRQAKAFCFSIAQADGPLTSHSSSPMVAQHSGSNRASQSPQRTGAFKERCGLTRKRRPSVSSNVSPFSMVPHRLVVVGSRPEPAAHAHSIALRSWGASVGCLHLSCALDRVMVTADDPTIGEQQDGPLLRPSRHPDQTGLDPVLPSGGK